MFEEARKQGLTNKSKRNIIDIEIDEIVPCLIDTKTGETIPTEISTMKRDELKKFTIKNGWNDDWAKRPENETIIGVFVKDETEPQGLIAIDVKKGGVYVSLCSTAPQNNKLLVGENQKYKGAGGHLFALAVEQSLKNGGGGTVFGYASNEIVLEHYKKAFGAEHIPIVHEYQFIIEGEAALNLLNTYNYNRRQ